MARPWIVVGDMTNSGGPDITGSSATDIDGKPVARVTDKATCPAHKGALPIVDGDVQDDAVPRLRRRAASDLETQFPRGLRLPCNGPMFISAHVLAEIVRPCLDRIDMVISSTWGASRPLDEPKALLPAGLAERVNDAVHHQRPPLDDFTRGNDIDSRFAEIAYYLTAESLGGHCTS